MLSFLDTLVLSRSSVICLKQVQSNESYNRKLSLKRKRIKNMADNGESNNVELIIANALKMPGVKVDRKEFLVKTFGDKLSSDKIPLLIDKGPQEAGFSADKINRMAKSLVSKRTLQSSGTSFAAGLPGGWAMAATIPADTLQFS